VKSKADDYSSHHKTEHQFSTVEKEITEPNRNYHDIYNLKNLPIKEINKEMIMKNPLIFKLKNEERVVDKEKLEKIKKLSLRNTLNADDTKIANKSNLLSFLKLPKKDTNKLTQRDVFRGFLGEVDFHQIVDDNKRTVKIENEEFLVSDTQKIAQKILTSCNYYRKKTTSGNNTGRSVVSTKSTSALKNIF
jgi:hypothetical protein